MGQTPSLDLKLRRAVRSPTDWNSDAYRQCEMLPLKQRLTADDGPLTGVHCSVRRLHAEDGSDRRRDLLKLLGIRLVEIVVAKLLQSC